MYKNYALTVCTFVILFQGLLHARTIDGADSALIKTYWNRVNIKSLTSLNNNLYNGIDNYLTLVCPDQESAAFRFYLTCNNGSIYDYDEGTFLALPQNIGKAFIAIKIITNDNDTLLIGKKTLNVLNLPLPALKIGNTVISENTVISKQVFFSNDTLKLFFSEDLPESNSWYKIEWFSIGYTYGSIYKSVDNYSPVFKAETLKVLQQACKNCELVIKVHTVSPSGILKNLPLVRFSAF
jgi:hypothetical protein